MKIQKGIVKYKNRNDIICTYGLTDDGKQYYFLDETDTKKFANGNRIVSTALVEAIDPMVKAQNIGVIDENGVVIIPFENCSIRPVNDTVILVEKANPTSQSVIDANTLRNDPNTATQLVSIPATIKSHLNAQMGVEGKYLFNDQFSEATLCDINGTNLIGGESFSFISMANDKLYMSKNTADSPVQEFSLTTYDMVASTPADQIDVSTAVVDQQVVEDALNGQAAVNNDVQGMVPPVENALVDGVVPTPEVPASKPVEGAPVDAVPVEAAPVTVPVEGAAPAPVEDPVMEYDDSLSTVVAGVIPGLENVAPADAMASTSVEGAPVEGVVPTPAVDAVAAPVEGAPVDVTPAEAAPVEEPISYDDSLSTIVPEGVQPTGDTPTESTVNSEFSTEDASISDDLKAFTGGVPADGESSEFELPPIVEEEEKAPVEESAPVEETPVEEAPTEEVKEESAPVEETAEEVKEESVPVEETTEEVAATPNPEEAEDVVPAPVEEEEETTPGPVAIDAETVLATVDRDGNGKIDSSEVMVPQSEPKEESFIDIFSQQNDDTDVEEDVSTEDKKDEVDLFHSMSQEPVSPAPSYGYNDAPLPTYETTPYTTPSSYLNDYHSILTDVKPDRMTYDYTDSSAGRDNIMLDVARSMSELMRKNKEQRGIITQYQDRVQTLESQTRVLNEKFKEQSTRYEALSNKLRSLDEASGRLESRNQLLESRIRDQEKIIAAQERELKVLRPQVEGKQDLVRLLADARTLLDSESGYGYNDGYSEGDSYYRRAA